MRVLFIAAHFDRPEAHMVAGLARAGCQSEAIVLPERRYADILEAAGVRVHTRDWSRAWWTPGRRSLRALAARAAPDIVHAFDNAALYDTWRAWPMGRAAWIAYRGAPFLSWRSRRLYRRCGIARVACLSETVRAEMLRRGFPNERITTIYKGHDPAWYRAASADRLRALGIPAGARLIGAAARWRDWKNGPVLVEAFHRLPSDPRVRLLMVGEVRDPRLERLRRDPRYSERVHYVGHQPDAAGLLGACEIAVMPSNEQEGLCKAVIEALAQGVPAVVSNVGGPAEIVRDGVEGLCVAPGDPAALAAALNRLLVDEPFRRACAAGALDRVRGAFNIATTVARYRALYDEILDARGRGAG